MPWDNARRGKKQTYERNKKWRNRLTKFKSGYNPRERRKATIWRPWSWKKYRSWDDYMFWVGLLLVSWKKLEKTVHIKFVLALWVHLYRHWLSPFHHNFEHFLINKKKKRSRLYFHTKALCLFSRYITFIWESYGLKVDFSLKSCFSCTFYSCIALQNCTQGPVTISLKLFPSAQWCAWTHLRSNTLEYFTSSPCARYIASDNSPTVNWC